MALMSTFSDYLAFLPTVQRTPGQNVPFSGLQVKMFGYLMIGMQILYT